MDRTCNIVVRSNILIRHTTENSLSQVEDPTRIVKSYVITYMPCETKRDKKKNIKFSLYNIVDIKLFEL